MAAPISTTYSPEQRAQIAEHVLEQLTQGRALSKILNDDDGMPSWPTFARWQDAEPELCEKVVRARELGVEKLLEETLEIADDSTRDYQCHEYQPENVQRSKLRIETRIKYAQMIAPRFKPGVDITSGGKALPAPPPPQLVDARIQSLLFNIMQRPDPDEETKRLME